VKVTDSHGCIKTQNGCGFSTNGFPYDSFIHTCILRSSTNGTITVDVTLGGIAPWTYNWTSSCGDTGNGTSATEPFTITGLAGGCTYTITTTNGNGCTETS
jgi:hypothetical protein